MADDNALSLWASKVASNESYRMADPETQRQVQIDFFKKHVAPNNQDDLKNSLITFMSATKPLDELPNDQNFLSLDDASRRNVMSMNMMANGLDPNAQGSQRQANINQAKSGAPMEYNSALDDAMGKFSNSKQQWKERAELLGQDAIALPVKATSLATSFMGGEDAANINKQANDLSLRRQQLQGQHPGMQGLETAAEVATLAPIAGAVTGGIQAAEGAGIGPRIAAWAGRQLGVGAISAPTAINPVAGGKDIAAENRREGKLGAATAVATNTVGEAALNPTTVGLARRIKSWFSKDSDLGAELISKTRHANPNMTDEQIQQELQKASSAVKTAPQDQINFTGAQSGSVPLQDMQSSIPSTNYAGETFKQFENPSASLVTPIQKQADTAGLPKAQEYIATKLQPQVKAEFNVAKSNAVNELDTAKKDFANKVYQQSRDAGVHGEALGQSKNQFATELNDLVKKNPDLQKQGLLKVKGGKVTSSIDAVNRMLAKTDGASQLTVGDATTMMKDLAETLDSSNADTIKPIMKFVEGKLSKSQSAGVGDIRKTISDFNDMIDQNTELTKQQFNAAAGLESRFAKEPIMKALHSGGTSGANVGKAVRTDSLDNITKITQDPILHKTTKAATAADIMDTLGPKTLGGKGTTSDLLKFADTYGDETAANNVKALFHDDPEFIKNFDTLRKNALEARKLNDSVRLAPDAAGASGLKQAAAGTIAQLSGVRGQLATAASGPLDFMKKKTFQYLRESITDPTKAAAILDAGAKLQKNKISYSKMYDDFIAKDMAVGAAESGKALTEQNKPADKFTPTDLTKPTKNGIMKNGLKEVVEPMSYKGTEKVNEKKAPNTPAPRSATPVGNAATPNTVAKKKSDKDLAFEVTVGKESGDKQFDAKGKPLTSKAGATGAAQIMPATGPEAAKLAGLPWDEKRFKLDKEYNKALGKAYFTAQLKAFKGNLAHTYAAYNAGPTATRKAIEKSKQTGQHWLSLLPAETQDYVTKNVKNYKKMASN